MRPLYAGMAVFLFMTLPMEANAGAIMAEANWAGPFDPVTFDCGTSGSITSGDFRIENTGTIGCPGGRGLAVGDGLNERTSWTLDFAADPFFPLFDLAAPLSAATLVLEFVPKGLPHAGDSTSDFCGDFVFVNPTSGGASVDNPSRPCSLFSFDVAAVVTIDLLTEYRLGSSSGPFATDMSDRLLNELADKGGLLGMQYNDDAIVTRAKLTLLSSIPEPATSSLFALGILGLGLFGFGRAKAGGGVAGAMRPR